MKAIAWDLAFFLAAFFRKTQNISKTGYPIKKVLRIKEIEHLISYVMCAIKSNLSPTIIVLLQFQKNKLKKTKKLNISKTVDLIKNVHRTKKM